MHDYLIAPRRNHGYEKVRGNGEQWGPQKSQIFRPLWDRKSFQFCSNETHVSNYEYTFRDNGEIILLRVLML